MGRNVKVLHGQHVEFLHVGLLKDQPDNLVQANQQFKRSGIGDHTRVATWLHFSNEVYIGTCRISMF